MSTKFFIIWLLPLLLCACVSKRKVLTSSVITSQQKDSLDYRIVESIRYDTVRLPGNIVTLLRPAPCDTAKPKLDSLFATLKPKSDTFRRGNVNLRITNLGNGMERIDCEADSLIAVIAAKDREISRYENRSKAATTDNTRIEVVTKYRTAWWWYVLAVCWLVWMLRNPIFSLLNIGKK